MKSGKILLLCVILIMLTAILCSCVPGDGKNTEEKPAGFFTGVWHGWIAPVSLIWSIFDKDISIYEVNNIGFWYNFGYYMAIISGFGGLAVSRRRRVVVKSERN